MKYLVIDVRKNDEFIEEFESKDDEPIKILGIVKEIRRKI